MIVWSSSIHLFPSYIHHKFFFLSLFVGFIQSLLPIPLPLSPSLPHFSSSSSSFENGVMLISHTTYDNKIIRKRNGEKLVHPPFVYRPNDDQTIGSRFRLCQNKKKHKHSQKDWMGANTQTWICFIYWWWWWFESMDANGLA